MSVYIKGMEMPTHCMDCPFMVSRDNDDCILQSAEANENFENWEQMKAGCPLIPIPEHGRLIDADALDDILADQSEDAYNRTHAPRSWERALSDMRDYLDGAPTIIPADKEGTE